jgi:hypothetical protein
MSEYRIYGKNGLFHQIVKQSAILSGRYAVLPKGSPDLNISSLMSGLDLPVDFKYPGVFCLPPFSEVDSAQAGTWQSFQFRLLFVTTSDYTGDNQLKTPDWLTNTSSHTVDQDWSDMNNLALEFINALEKLYRSYREFFRLDQKNNYRVIRVSKMQNDAVSGVILTLHGSVPSPCEYTDINLDEVIMPDETHENHFH